MAVSSTAIAGIVVGIGVFALLKILMYIMLRKVLGERVWKIAAQDLVYATPRVLLGHGAFGVVVLAKYRGTRVAVKTLLVGNEVGSNKVADDGFASAVGKEVKSVGTRSTTTMDNNKASSGGTGRVERSMDVELGGGAKEGVAAEAVEAAHVSVPEWVPPVAAEEAEDGQGGGRGGPLSARKSTVKVGARSDEDAKWEVSEAARESLAARGGFSKVRVTKRSNGRTLVTVDGTMRRASRRRALQDFRKEIRLLSRLRHPNIMTVMGAVVEKGQLPSLVMEFMEAGSLYHLLHNRSVPVEPHVALGLLQDVASGMTFLHLSGILHNDLKSRNVLVDARFRAKVADFGLSTLHATARHVGTPLWMAPELLRGEPASPASDVYSFAIVAWEVLTRREPYDEMDLGAVLDEVANPYLEPPTRPFLPSIFNEDITSLIRDCWHRKPHRRPSFEEIQSRLARMDASALVPRVWSPGALAATPVAAAWAAAAEAHESKGGAWASDDDAADPKASASVSLVPKPGGRPTAAEHVTAVVVGLSDATPVRRRASGLASPEEDGAWATRAVTGPVVTAAASLLRRVADSARDAGLRAVATGGAAFVAVAGLRGELPVDQARAAGTFALECIRAATELGFGANDLRAAHVRVGIHGGPVSVAATSLGGAARVSLFGDTMSIAGAMEKAALPGRILVSGVTARLMRAPRPQGLGRRLERTDEVEVAGKGDIEVHWLLDESA